MEDIRWPKNVDNAWQEEKRKTATIMEEPCDEFREKQTHGGSYVRRQTHWTFGNGQSIYIVLSLDLN